MAAEGLKPDANRPRTATCDRLTGRYQFHSQHEAQPRWEVGLGRPCPIDTVILHNRSDNAQHRPSVFSITVSIEAGGSDHVHHHTEAVIVGNGLEQRHLRISVDPAITLGFVRIRLAGPAFLHLDQLEVLGVPLG